jgi:glycerol-3-phosphate acyltransferase PlsX
VSLTTIAVDAMGGDQAPGAVVAGALQAVKRRDVAVVLTGPADVIRHEIEQLGGAAGLPLTIADAPQTVSMEESPLAAHRRKPGSSVRVAAGLVARGEAAALFSAGHTGATFLAAHAAFGTLAGVGRPALAVTVPTRRGRDSARCRRELDCLPEHLCQFGVMGAAYARIALKVERPRVGLLSIGEEAGKGNDLIREAHALLARAPIEFLGNLEAREFFTGRVDVIVCDGFTGNIALKVGEGLVELAQEMVREELGVELLSQVLGLFTRRAFARFKQRMDYAETGGAPLLGLDGLAIVGHGRSSPQAVESGIATAAKLADQQTVRRLREALASRADR